MVHLDIYPPYAVSRLSQPAGGVRELDVELRELRQRHTAHYTAIHKAEKIAGRKTVSLLRVLFGRPVFQHHTDPDDAGNEPGADEEHIHCSAKRRHDGE